MRLSRAVTTRYPLASNSVLPTVVAILIGCLPNALWGQASQWSNGSGGAIYYNGGSVGIGVTAPETTFEVRGQGLEVRSIASKTDSTARQLLTLTSDDPLGSALQLAFTLQGATTSNFGTRYATIQAADNGFWWAPLILQPYGSNVGIGTSNPQYLLSVNGTVGAKEVIVTTTGWSDYVFKPDYRLQPLNEVAAYIQENHHLPEIPSESEVKEKGISLGDLQAKLLAKVEELTLHAIEADERSNRLEQENRDLQARLAQLETGTASANH